MSPTSDLLAPYAQVAIIGVGMGSICLLAPKKLFSWRNDDCARVFAEDRAARLAEAQARPRRRTVRLLLIRHAQSESNKHKNSLHNGRHIGVPLSEAGRAQARALGKRLRLEGLQPDEVYCSEALRTQQTAELACAELEAPPKINIITTETSTSSRGRSPAASRGICEISMGGWTGKNKSECETPSVAAAREVDRWEWRPPGVSFDEGLPGESYRDVEQRVMRVLDELILPAHVQATKSAASKQPPPLVLIFAHHATIRCALRALLEASPRMLAPKLSPANTSITELLYTGGVKTRGTRNGGWSLIRVNDSAHLAPWFISLTTGAEVGSGLSSGEGILNSITRLLLGSQPAV